MHLLIILLQQLLGMLPSSKKAPQGEVVRTRQPNSSAAETDACQRRTISNDGWMTIFRGDEQAGRPALERAPRGARLSRGNLLALAQPATNTTLVAPTNRRSR